VDAAITQGSTEELTAKQTQTEIQRTMETNILSLEAGSMAQQVQASKKWSSVSSLHQIIV
jgi:hypothetical protein